jgi:transcriptional regulator with PAS, ATPase and Fis domain
MAGSFIHLPQPDSILTARIEALASLADHLAEPVMVVSPTHDLVYANTSAKQLIDDCPLLEQVQEDGGAFENRPQPCEACPARNVLELGSSCQKSGHSQSSESIVSTCPFPKALPLIGIQDHIRCVLMLGETGRETVVLNSSLADSPPISILDRPETSPLDAIVGKSEAMQQVFDTIRLVATSQATVLLQGESGTGKELVAKTIHRLSPRRDAPFIVIDCGALPETLLESELFGHRRGAFTGAVSDRKGLFEEAEGGTIFLDEIANTSASFQAKLLRVLQEGEVKPVGSNHRTKVDVRIISASNMPLEQLIEAQAFRIDLYYRLAVLPLTLPPLREREEDIPLLIEAFIHRACQKHDKAEVNIAPDAVRQLTQKTWLGNVRELEHAIERLVLTTQGLCIQVTDVEESPDSNPATPDLYQMRKLAQSKVEKDMIVKALREANGNKVLAAKLLSISRATLYNKIKAYAIS